MSLIGLWAKQGGGIGWVLYNHEDVEIPIEYFAESLLETINTDERVINSSTNIEATMEAIVQHRVQVFVPADSYEPNFRGYIHYYLTGGNQDLVNYFDFLLDVYVYDNIGRRLNIITAASFAMIVVLLVLLLLIADPKKQTVLKLMKVMAIVYASINILFIAVLFLMPSIANAMVQLRSYAEFIVYASSLFRAYGYIMIFMTAVLIALAFIFRGAQVKAEIKYQEYLKSIES